MRCIICNTDKTAHHFYTYRNTKAGVTYEYKMRRCKTCHCEEQKRLRKQNNYNQRSQKLRTERKQKAVEYLGNKCHFCDVSYPLCVYDFHHINPKQDKKHNRDVLGIKLRNSWDNIVKELDKCILLCANCHRMEHYA